MTSSTTITRVNLYIVGGGGVGVWCYAAWAGDEHDHNDTLPDADSREDAVAEIRETFGADVEIRHL